MKSLKKQGGFTLLELLVVVGLMAGLEYVYVL
jgi:prepilin-type N-terminal cleavage/methylation domain-containing protein